MNKCTLRDWAIVDSTCRITAQSCFRWIMVIVFVLSGCGPVRARPVKVEVARQTLIKVLEHWQNGGTIEQLRTERPEIVAQEPLWSTDKKLVEYTLLDEGRAEDANWFCEVELSLSIDGSDKLVKKKVTYVVGTDPVLTVFHAIL